MMQVLDARTPRDVEKKKRVYKDNLPSGSARFIINSPEYRNVLEKREARTSQKKTTKVVKKISKK